MFKLLYGIQLDQYIYFTTCYSVEYNRNKYIHEKLLWDNIHPNWRLQLLYNETVYELKYVEIRKIDENNEFINYYFNIEKRKHKYVLNDWYQNINPTKLNSKDQYVTPLQNNKQSSSFPQLPEYFKSTKVCNSLSLINNKLYFTVPDFISGYYYFIKGRIVYDSPLS